MGHQQHAAHGALRSRQNQARRAARTRISARRSRKGSSYTLLIDREWQDARGVPLAEDFRKAFRGGPADRTPPDPKTWRVTAPKAGSPADLVVDFPKPMDFALLQRMIEVSGSGGKIGGTVAVDKQETEWRFTPREPWKAGGYRLLDR